jgi:CCR4-NOT transcription complex subunit 6
VFGSNEFLRGNVGLAVHLKATDMPSEPDFVVSTTHLHWAPHRDFVKYAQIKNTLSHLEELLASIAKQKGISPSDIPLILCGDMNSTAKDSVYRYLINQEIKPNKAVKEENRHFYEAVTKHFDEMVQPQESIALN